MVTQEELRFRSLTAELAELERAMVAQAEAGRPMEEIVETVEAVRSLLAEREAIGMTVVDILYLQLDDVLEMEDFRSEGRFFVFGKSSSDVFEVREAGGGGIEIITLHNAGSVGCGRVKLTLDEAEEFLVERGRRTR